MSSPEPRVLLLSMPWAALGEPALGLGVLASCLKAAGVTVRVRHLHLFLLRRLQARTYLGLANAFALNDFMFTHDLDPEVSGVQRRLIRQRFVELSELGVLSLAKDPDEAVDALVEARSTIFPQWLDECADFVVANNPTLVGFSCLFDQTIPSIALARKIRDRLPAAMIVLGGYGMEGPIGRETLRCFPWINAVCLGEGEPAIVPLAAASVGQRPLSDIPNILTRETTVAAPVVPQGLRGLKPALREALPTRAAPLAMDDSPVPDFDDYFDDLAELNRIHQVEIVFDTLPIETSRGCWWGQKHHCVFCGIDDETMRYRSRSPQNTIAMMDELSRRYGVRSFRFSDYILPYQYFRTLLPELSARAEPYHLECELKANLTGQHFKLLVDAGFRECQPGIESFSTSVLEKMRKGVTGMRNVQTLVLGRMNGVRIHYNFLWGFPTDELAEYESQLNIIPRLYHLDPPHGRQPVEVTRFAPLQADPERFGIPRAHHAAMYGAIFSPRFLDETGFDLDAYAYYFERPYASSCDLERTYTLLSAQIDHWKTLRKTRPVELNWTTVGGMIEFRDTRFSEEPVVSRFSDRHRAVFEVCCGAVCSVEAIVAHTDLDCNEVVLILEDLDAARVVLREGGSCLGLATPIAPPPQKTAFQRKWVAA